MRDLPTPKTVDSWCAALSDDLRWLYDAKTGRCGGYAWAYSACDGLQSARMVTRGRTGHTDPTGSQIEAQKPSDEGGRGTFKHLSRAVQAAQHVKVAHERLAKARKILEERDLSPTEGDTIVFLRKGELDRLYRNQAEREAAGGGFGET